MYIYIFVYVCECMAVCICACISFACKGFWRIDFDSIPKPLFCDDSVIRRLFRLLLVRFVEGNPIFRAPPNHAAVGNELRRADGDDDDAFESDYCVNIYV